MNKSHLNWDWDWDWERPDNLEMIEALYVK
jgi:hypothetical protein